MLEVFTNLAKNQGNVFSFMWIREVTFHLNLIQTVALLSHNQLSECCWGEMLKHSMLITAFIYYCFKFKVKNSLMMRLAFGWVSKRVRNESTPILILHLIPLISCHWIPAFANFNLLTSSNSLPCKCWGNTYPNMTSKSVQGIMPSTFSCKIWGDLLLKSVPLQTTEQIL